MKMQGLTCSKTSARSSLVGASESSIPNNLLLSTSLGSSIIMVSLTYKFRNHKSNFSHNFNAEIDKNV